MTDQTDEEIQEESIIDDSIVEEETIDTKPVRKKRTAKEKTKIYNSIYYQVNKLKMDAKDKQYKKQYRLKNSEKLKAKAKIYRDTNKEKVAEQNRRYRRKNLEQYNLNQQAYRKRNLEEQKEYMKNYMREYRLKNKEKIKAIEEGTKVRRAEAWTNPTAIRKHLRKNGLLLRKAKVQDEATCKTAVRQTGRALIYVEEEFLTDEVCMYAIQYDIHALQWIEKPSEKVLMYWVACCSVHKQEYELLYWFLNHSRHAPDLTSNIMQLIFKQMRKYVKGETDGS